jgi:hypothetical protein
LERQLRNHPAGRTLRRVQLRIAEASPARARRRASGLDGQNDDPA